MPPHHALGHSGCTAGVDDEMVVVAARAEVAGIGLRRKRVLVVVADDQHVGDLRTLRNHSQSGRHEFCFDQQCHHLRVGVDVQQFCIGITEVDVDRHRSDLQARQERFDVLDAVTHVNTDMLARFDADGLQMMSEAVRSQFEFGVAQPRIFQDQGNSIGDRIGNGLEQIGNVQGHRIPHYTRLHLPAQVFREANTLLEPCSPNCVEVPLSET